MECLYFFISIELRESLRQFFSEQTQVYLDEEIRAYVEPIQNGQLEQDGLIDQWLKTFQECKSYTRIQPVTDEDLFSNIYHSVLLTDRYEDLLLLEVKYQDEIKDLLNDRDKQIQELDTKHSREMQDVVNEPTNKYPDVYVRNVAQKHMEDKQLVEGKWNSEIISVKERQKQEFKNYVMQLSLQNQLNQSLQANKIRRKRNTNSLVLSVDESTTRRLETSYTVQLGAQLKSMHNLRLIRCDILEFCRLKTYKKGNQVFFEPQRLQTLMSLFSNSLSGVVLLVQKRSLLKADMKEEFGSVCERSTDFHFPSYEQQMATIDDCIEQANQQRTVTSSSSAQISQSNSNADLQSINSKHSASDEDRKLCSVGDFYVTKHSNLSEIHLALHLVVDDSLKSSDITSRHPTILGLRNILKACCRHDVTTLTLPILLTHEMTEEMTIAWVMKRTELVLKCLKGFMMEMATWGTNKCTTIQLIVPKSLLEQTFYSMADLLPTIFRESRTVTLNI
ncbi:unnamed protein product [Didymodactylos carnosus]|uniref:Uncharacterized protein n=1 Tax=Didymodactylos carnosus TaxID=1234261 RepID=A0A813UEI1_9BILA|nr:unnamed protein product [Didymodactylos carnosus]CAF3612357.1 unnamed protein product [Didymodactylos carnosus]